MLAPSPGGAPASERPRGRLTVGAMAGAGVCTFALGLALRPIGDNSFLTHLATGRLLLRHGVPKHDPFTFTAGGRPWVVQSWLASFAYAVADRAASSRGVQVLAAATVLVLVAQCWRLTRPARDVRLRLVSVAAVLAIGSGAWVARPYLFGLALLGATLLVVERRRSPRWLVPVGWLWVNTHGSFPLGLVAVGLLGAGRWLDERRSEPERTAFAHLGVGVLLGAIGPVGPRLLSFPIELLRNREALAQIVEWRAPTFTSLWQLAFLAQLALVAWSLMRRPCWRALLPALVFGAMALTSSRNIAVASVVLLASASPGLRVGRGREGQQSGKGRHGQPGQGRFDAAATLRLPGGVMIGAIISVATVVVAVALGQPAAGYGGYPLGALAWAGRAGLLDGQHRIVAPDFVGNLVEAAYGGAVPVFVDDRAELHDGALVGDLDVLNDVGPDWSVVLDQYRADVVVWPRRRPLAQAIGLSASWHVAYQDAGWTVAVRSPHRSSCQRC